MPPADSATPEARRNWHPKSVASVVVCVLSSIPWAKFVRGDFIEKGRSSDAALILPVLIIAAFVVGAAVSLGLALWGMYAKRKERFAWMALAFTLVNDFSFVMKWVDMFNEAESNRP